MPDPKKRYEATAAKFRRLIEGLLDSQSRPCFEPWEIELLLDISEVEYSDFNQHRRLLGQYMEDVAAEMEHGAAHPAKLSEYLARRMTVSSVWQQRTAARGA